MCGAPGDEGGASRKLLAECTFGRVIGRGRYADARLLHHLPSDRVFVAKQLMQPVGSVDDHGRRHTLEMAWREVDILKLMNHRGVVSLVGHFVRDDVFNIVTAPYASRGTLECLLRRHKHKRESLRAEMLCAWAVQLAAALRYIHAQGVLHRDLKTANIFVCAGDRLVIGDFGVSKREGQADWERDVEMEGTCIGTPYYLSPEVVLGRAYGRKNDVWALGVVLYELCALRRPFEGANIHELAQQIVGKEPAPIRGLPRVLTWLVPRMLAKCCRDRPCSTRVAEALVAVDRYGELADVAGARSHVAPSPAHETPSCRPAEESARVNLPQSYVSCSSNPGDIDSASLKEFRDVPSSARLHSIADAEGASSRCSEQSSNGGGCGSEPPWRAAILESSSTGEGARARGAERLHQRIDGRMDSTVWRGGGAGHTHCQGDEHDGDVGSVANINAQLGCVQGSGSERERLARWSTAQSIRAPQHCAVRTTTAAVARLLGSWRDPKSRQSASEIMSSMGASPESRTTGATTGSSGTSLHHRRPNKWSAFLPSAFRVELRMVAVEPKAKWVSHRHAASSTNSISLDRQLHRVPEPPEAPAA